MQSKAKNPDDYIAGLPEERKGAMSKLRKAIVDNLPSGFVETMSYGMIGYVIPHSAYPDGYHCDPKLPLPFINIASQKNHIAVYHMGIYGDKNLLSWFTNEYSKLIKTKLNMGKGCIRFKKVDQIPYDLIGDLSSRVTPSEWIKTYETLIKK